MILKYNYKIWFWNIILENDFRIVSSINMITKYSEKYNNWYTSLIILLISRG